MFTTERQQNIVALLEKKRRLSNAELLASLEISSATLRRDLAELEGIGRVVRFHGGAAHPAYLQGEPTHEEKSKASRSEKRAIAAATAARIPDKATVFLDSGTTCLEVGRALMSRGDLTILANSIAFAQMARQAAARVICLGGEVRGVTGALVGSLTLAWLERMSADYAIVGASGLDESGASTTELSESEIKRALIAHARNRILVADASKWARASLIRFADWSDFQFWITAGSIDRNTISTVSKAGPQVVRAPM